MPETFSPREDDEDEELSCDDLRREIQRIERQHGKDARNGSVFEQNTLARLRHRLHELDTNGFCSEQPAGHYRG